MADNEKYSNAQRISFAGLTIGMLLCCVGGGAQYWLTVKITTDDITDIFSFKIPFIGESSLMEIHLGIWAVCMETGKVLKAFADEEGCQFIPDLNDDSILFKKTPVQKVICVAVVVNVLTSIVCAVAAWCRCCCCGGGRTIVHGIAAFVSGGAGLLAVGLFASHGEDIFRTPLPDVEYEWAFAVYILGVGIITASSFALCFASPDVNFRGFIFGQQPASTYVQMTNETHSVNNGYGNGAWATNTSNNVVVA